MTISTSETINASAVRVWQIITDIDNAQQNRTAILDIQVLNRPDTGIIGLEWKEVRKMFGIEAAETMTISDVAGRTLAE